MRIAFYAPLKPPDHPTPSGDRRMARLLIDALGFGGHAVELACHFRSREGAGDPARQRRIARVGARLAEGLIRRYRRGPAKRRPQAWFTYHLYYKAPDHLGPRIAEALGIPYVIAEASHAEKRARGPYAHNHAVAAAAIARADAAIVINGADGEGLARILPPERCHRLPPFLDAERLPAPSRAEARRALSEAFGLPQEEPWLLSVAMMRAPDKLASYRMLAEAVQRLDRLAWRLILVGDGPQRAAVEAAFAPLGDRVVFAGLRRPEEIARFHAAADLFVWPAVNEAYGMAILEAEAAALPVVAARVGGVPEIVADGQTGLLAPANDPAAFAVAVATLLQDERLRLRLGCAAALRVAERHGFAAAAERLDAVLRAVAR
ncbi:MAG TPA: glycosyltransferase family 4 protein [Methylomirabilota bacterium]|jgi:glycosyltransferase involved in cell wall biosynthesis|nr:glycosyltransferase family 4 protein [Methylomirabilota bacterium]